MSENLSFGLLALTSFFTLMNPLGTMPIFLSMTAGLDSRNREKTARKAVIVSFFVLVAFAFTGQLLFQFFGISIHSLKVVGGIIFFIMGQDMLQARISKVKVTESETQQYVSDIAITPLAIPMICGPGAITNSIVLMEDADSVIKKVILIASLFIILFIAYIVLWGSSKITKFMGETGNKIMMRLMGLIVMVIAVEFFFSGLKPILQNIFN